MSDIRDQEPAIGCPEVAVGVAKAAAKNLPASFSVAEFGVGIVTGNAVAAIFAVLALWINPQNRAPNAAFVVANKMIAVFRSATVAYTNVQQAILRITTFGQWIKGDLLYAVDTRHHIDAQQLPAISRKRQRLGVVQFPLGEHPLHGYFD